MATLELRDLSKRFGPVEVLHGLDLAVEDGEFVVLVGPSGCGKSTLLRIVAGLESASGGDLLVDGERVNDVPVQRRDTSMVFQSYALFPHMSVRENIGYGARVRGEDAASAATRVGEVAELLNLAPYLERRPAALSGGQRQRVAMGRALMREPKLFLFDEPLSNLDAQLRVAMRAEIKALHARLGNTIVYVTHDQVEAMTMADRIVVMRAGRIVQVGTPLELYDAPADLFVASFIGSPAMGFVRGRLDGAALHAGPMTLALPTPRAGPSRDVVVGVRPDAFALAPPDAPEGLPATVRVVEPTGSETHVLAALDDAGLRHLPDDGAGDVAGDLRAVVRGRAALRAGDRVRLVPEAAGLHLFEPETARRIA